MSDRKAPNSLCSGILVVMFYALCCLPHAQGRVSEGLGTTPSAESMLKHLQETRPWRDAARIRRSMIGTAAPRLCVREWLVAEPNVPKPTWPGSPVVCLYFWQDTCGPCISSLPATKELAAWITSKGGAFLSIHRTTADANTVRELIRKHDIRFPVALDAKGDGTLCWGSATFQRYGVDATPTYVTIGKEGIVLTYDPPSKAALETVFSARSHAEDLRQRRTPEEPITKMPQAWAVTAARPAAKVHASLLIYRPDTPDLVVESPQDEKTTEDRQPITLSLNRHTDKGQTVYQATIECTSPDWGRSTDGELTLSARHGSVRETLRIRYSVQTAGLIQFVPSTVFFGTVAPGEAVTRTVTGSIPNGGSSVDLEIVSMPADLEATISRPRKGNDVAVNLRFRSQTPGLRKGVVRIRALDSRGNSQRIELGYSAFVRPAAGQN